MWLLLPLIRKIPSSFGPQISTMPISSRSLSCALRSQLTVIYTADHNGRKAGSPPCLEGALSGKRHSGTDDAPGFARLGDIPSEHLPRQRPAFSQNNARTEEWPVPALLLVLLCVDGPFRADFSTHHRWSTAATTSLGWAQGAQTADTAAHPSGP